MPRPDHVPGNITDVGLAGPRRGGLRPARGAAVSLAGDAVSRPLWPASPPPPPPVEAPRPPTGVAWAVDFFGPGQDLVLPTWLVDRLPPARLARLGEVRRG